MADSKLDREFLRSILTLAAKPAVDHLLVVMDVPLGKDELRGRALKRKIIYAVSADQLAQNLRKQGYLCVTVPPYDYSRVEKVKVALVAAMTANALRDGEDVLCMTGRTGARLPDTVVRLQIGRGFEEKASIDTQGLGAEFSSQVVEALVSLAMAIGHEGFEGHPIGTIFVLGDSTVVMEKSKQLTINPLQGISEAERNVLDPQIREAIKNFAVLDGAFVIREDGVVLAAGRYLHTGEGNVELPLGLGARHAAAAAITLETQAVSISVSQSSGAVRVFKGGQAVLELQQVARRSEPSPSSSSKTPCSRPGPRPSLLGPLGDTRRKCPASSTPASGAPSTGPRSGSCARRAAICPSIAPSARGSRFCSSANRRTWPPR